MGILGRKLNFKFMIQKSFLNRNNKRGSRNARRVTSASNLMLYLGVVVLIVALFYMISNYAEADKIISIWLPFMLAGVFLIFISHLFKREAI